MSDDQAARIPEKGTPNDHLEQNTSQLSVGTFFGMSRLLCERLVHSVGCFFSWTWKQCWEWGAGGC